MRLILEDEQRRAPATCFRVRPPSVRGCRSLGASCRLKTVGKTAGLLGIGGIVALFFLFTREITRFVQLTGAAFARFVKLPGLAWLRTTGGG
jgi:hypothetical protein